jgi:hypothetical protein
MARPYNHPDNLKENGQPKMSEDAWELSEKIREGTDDVDWMLWPEGLAKPADLSSAVSALLSEVRRLRLIVEEPKDFLSGEKDTPDAPDFMKFDGDEGDLSDFMKVESDPEEYVPGNPLAWECDGAEPPCRTKTNALDCLRMDVDEKALRVEAVETDDVAAASASYSQAQMDEVIALVNELKAKLNEMNS